MKWKTLTFWVLILTINQNIYKVLRDIIPRLQDQGVDEIVIGHQIFDTSTKAITGIPQGVTYVVSYEPGVSKNRNIVIQHCTTDIFHICWDDIVYEHDFVKHIKKEFFKTPDYGIITFQALSREYRTPLIWIKKSQKHSYISLLKTKSCGFVYNRRVICAANISFDENFWLGTDIPTGEEHIFWNALLRSWYQARHVTVAIVSHPSNTSWTNTQNLDLISARVFVFRRMFWCIWGVFAAFFFTIREYKNYRPYISCIGYMRLSLWAVFSKIPWS